VFRVNGLKVKKVAMLVKQGDVIIFYYGSELKAIKVLILGKQRQTSVAALDFYEDLTDNLFISFKKN
jgi:ribosomal 50S subunit-recycling heat shock protein